MPNAHNPTHSSQSRRGLPRWTVVVGIAFIVCALFCGLGGLLECRGKSQISRAGELWLGGDKDEATRIYVRELQYVEATELPEVYGRIITQRYDSGDMAGVDKYCNKAIEENIDVQFDRDDVRRVFADARRADEAAKRAKEQQQAAMRAQKEDALMPVSGNTPAEATRPLRRRIAKSIGTEGLAFEINNYFADPQQLIIQVRFDIDDNLTNNSIRRGSMRDIASILKAVDESGINCHEVTVFGSFPLVDKFGNSSKEVVVKATYSDTTVNRINWSNFQTENVYEIADNVWQHPAFRE
jgi:hypothetical protein